MLATVRFVAAHGPAGRLRACFEESVVRGPRATWSERTIREGRARSRSRALWTLVVLKHRCDDVHGWADSRSVLRGTAAERHSRHTESRAVLHMA